MRIFTPLIGKFLLVLTTLMFFLHSSILVAQTTSISWKGTTSSDWNTATNWTGGAVPTAATDVVIGDANFTGTNQPEIDENGVVNVKSITLQGTNTAGTAVYLLVSNNFQVNVYGNITVGDGTTFENNGTAIVLQGDLINNGVFKETTFIKNQGIKGRFYPTFEMSGAGKRIGGTKPIILSHLAVTGSVSLENNLFLETMNITVNGNNTPPSSDLTVRGTFDPAQYKVTFNTPATASFIVEAGATIKVQATTFTANYSHFPTSSALALTTLLSPTGIVEYAAARDTITGITGDQSIFTSSSAVYGILKITGSGTKTLTGDTKVNATSDASQVLVEKGSLDLAGYTLTRASATGGTLSVSNGATMKLSGANNFPTGFVTKSFGLTSTVEYYGAGQTVANEFYGNLTLSGSGTKTMPATAAMTIQGNLTSSGTTTYTAANNITVNGSVTIGAGTTFGGASHTITAGGNWTNEGTFAHGTGNVVLNGSGKQIIRAAAGDATFNNLSITNGLITTAVNSLIINGDLSTVSASNNGAFTQTAGTLTMAGSTKSIAGANITLNNLSATGSISTAASFIIYGNLNVGGSLVASGGTIQMAGIKRTTDAEGKPILVSEGKSITATGALTFFGLRFPTTSGVISSISTSSSFKVTSDFSGTGKLTASSPSVITFDGTSTFAGTHDLFDVTVSAGKTLTMVANANMGVAGALTTAGTLNVVANVPNTITFNGTSAQSIPGREYNNIAFANAGIKTAGGGITVNGNLTINTGSNFTAGTFTHTINGNWDNGGTFNAGTSTVKFAGTSDATLTGNATTFAILTVEKAAATNNITLNTSATAATLNLTTGWMRTSGNNSITVTQGRSGNGWVVGTIIRNHTFTSGTGYAFAGPSNLLAFTDAPAITSVTVKNTTGVISDFSVGSAINRTYEVTVAPSGTYAGTMQLQYDDADLNGNVESKLQLYQDEAKNGTWVALNKTSNDSTSNWVNKTSIANLNGKWTLSAAAGIVRWVGAGTTTAWTEAANWDLRVPTTSDIAVFGDAGVVGIKQPVLSTPATVRSIQFKGKDEITLTLNSGGSLTVSGNLTASGGGVGGARRHAIIVNNQSLTVAGDLTLNEGNTDNSISLNIGTGTVAITGSLNQGTDSNIAFTDNGNLKIKGDYNKTAGNFTTSGTGTVTYEGNNAQVVAAIPYHHLTTSKPSGAATLSGADITITGNLTVNGAGAKLLAVSGLTVNGNVSVTSGTLDAGNSTLNVNGNWDVSGSGVFVPGTSTVNFTGGNAQTVTASTFNKLTIAKTSGTVLTATGDIRVNANLELQSGIVDLGTKTMDRSAVGGSFTMGDGAKLILSASNFPARFNAYTLHANSTVEYTATAVAQDVAQVTYGHLTLVNGGTTNAKKLLGATRVNGKLTIAGTTDGVAKLDGNGQTLTLGGDFEIKTGGLFTAGATYADGTLVLAGTTITEEKQLNGAITVNNLLLEATASYALSSNAETSLTVKGDFNNQGSINGSTKRVTIDGNFLNTATLISSGTAAFTGGRQQTIQLQAPITAGPAGAPTVEFNGTEPPVLNSTASPAFGNVFIKNIGGVTASVDWIVAGQFIIYPGAAFHGGPYAHTFYTVFSNNGTVTSSGLIDFKPPYPGVNLAGHPFKFGNSAEAFTSTGTLKLGGSKQILLYGTVPASLNNLIIANTAGITPTSLDTAYVLTGDAWNITGNLTVESGATLNAIPGKSFTINGNLVNNGNVVSINPATGAHYGVGGDFIFNGASSQISGSGTTMLGNVTVASGKNLDINNNITIFGSLTHNGSSFSAQGAELTFAGAYPAAISSASPAPLSIEYLKIGKSAPATAVTLGTGLDAVRSITVGAGTLDASDKTITAAEGTTGIALLVADAATYKLSATTLPDLESYAFAPTSTVNYYGTNPQTVKGDLQYGHLSLDGASAKTFSGTTTSIAGDFTVASDVASVTTPAAIDYNGSNAQTVAAVNYNNLTLSTSSAKTLAAGTVGVADAFTNPGNSTLDAVANSTTVDYNGAAQNVLTADYYNLKLSNSGIKTFAGRTGVANQFTLSGAAADLTTTETTIDFNGTGAQAIPALNYSKVLLSAGGDKTLAGNANVAQELRLTNGKINTGSNKFILGGTASLVETKDHYVTGFVETQRNMTAAMESFGGLGVSITPTVAPGLVTVLRETGSPIVVASGNTSISRNYSFATSGTNSNLNATVSFEYYPHELSGLDANTLQLATSADGTTWKMHGKSVADPDRNMVGANTVNSLSRMTLGSSVTPLPVELKYLRAEKACQNAVITWETATEESNKGFEVEVSLDGVNYRKLGFVSNRVTTSRAGSLYTFTDKEAGKVGIRYYRLKQLDLDGKYTYYGPRSVTFELQQAVSLMVFPNPVKDQMQVRFSAAGNGITKAALYTLTGKKVYEETLSVEPGINTKQLQVDSKGLSPGVYMLVLEIDGVRQSIKVVKD